MKTVADDVADDGVAVVFDLDGVVVDTVGHLYDVYREVLDRFGAAGTRAEFDRLNGCNLGEIVAFLAEHHHLGGREEELRSAFAGRFDRLYENVGLVDGAVATLEALERRGVGIGLASSSARRNVDAVLERFGVGRFFDFVVSGDDVARAKPHPEIYRLAMERSGRPQCFAVEDSANGVEAARRAGVVAIHFDPAGGGAEGDAEGPWPAYHVGDLREVERIAVDDEAVVVARAPRIELRRGDDPPELPAAEEGAVDELWRAAVAENPSLWNGEVAVHRGHRVLASGTLVVDDAVCEYKYVYAQLHGRGPGWARPLAVSAVVVDAAGRVLLGRRSGSVTEYPGRYELVPAGGLPVGKLEGTAYLGQVEAELVEETGIGPENVQEAVPFCLVYDRIHRVFDVGVKLTLSCRVDVSTLASEEHADFVALEPGALAGFVHRQPVVPTTVAVLRVLAGPGAAGRPVLPSPPRPPAGVEDR